MMESLVEERLKNKKKERKSIVERVEKEQINPTSSEKRSIKELINDISMIYSKELTSANVDPDELNRRIKQTIRKKVEALNFSFEKKRRIEKMAIDNIIGLGPLQSLLDDPDISEIVVQRYDKICIERNGRIAKTRTSFTDEDHLLNIINRVLQPISRSINLATPIVDARLKDGSRVCATIPPVSPDGATLTIRKFQNEKMTVDKYVELRSISKEAMEFLEKCVRARISLFVSGGTGTGKTTMLNALSSFIANNELIVTIEDTLELQLHQDNVRRMETRQSENENLMTCDMAALVKTALRMRPDILLLGEIRDGAVIHFLSASSTGHEGSMCTAHANSPENLVNVRIPIMISMDKNSQFSEQAQAYMISEALQIIVQLKRLRNGRRIVSRITGVNGVNEKGQVALVDIYTYDIEKDELVCSGKIPRTIYNYFKNYGVSLDREFTVVDPYAGGM